MWCVFWCPVPGTSCLEEAFLKVMGKEAPIEVMDMEKAMSTAGLLELFEVEARLHDFAFCFADCRVACAIAGLAASRRLQRASGTCEEVPQALGREG